MFEVGTEKRTCQKVSALMKPCHYTGFTLSQYRVTELIFNTYLVVELLGRFQWVCNSRTSYRPSITK